MFTLTKRLQRIAVLFVAFATVRKALYVRSHAYVYLINDRNYAFCKILALVEAHFLLYMKLVLLNGCSRKIYVLVNCVRRLSKSKKSMEVSPKYFSKA